MNWIDDVARAVARDNQDQLERDIADAENQRLARPDVPGFSPALIWDSPTEPVAGLVTTGASLPTPGPRALNVDWPVDSGETVAVEALAGGITWYLWELLDLLKTPQTTSGLDLTARADDLKESQ